MTWIDALKAAQLLPFRQWDALRAYWAVMWRPMQ